MEQESTRSVKIYKQGSYLRGQGFGDNFAPFWSKYQKYILHFKIYILKYLILCAFEKDASWNKENKYYNKIIIIIIIKL